MDGKAILEAAEWCVNNCNVCRIEDAVGERNAICDGEAGVAKRVLAVRDYILGEIREWVEAHKETFCFEYDEEVEAEMVNYYKLIAKLDGMKAH